MINFPTIVSEFHWCAKATNLISTSLMNECFYGREVHPATAVLYICCLLCVEMAEPLHDCFAIRLLFVTASIERKRSIVLIPFEHGRLMCYAWSVLCLTSCMCVCVCVCCLNLPHGGGVSVCYTREGTDVSGLKPHPLSCW